MANEFVFTKSGFTIGDVVYREGEVVTEDTFGVKGPLSRKEQRKMYDKIFYVPREKYIAPDPDDIPPIGHGMVNARAEFPSDDDEKEESPPKKVKRSK